jgi:DNA ligase-1
MNKVFDKLYSEDSSGNIRVWWIEQKDNMYRTHSGVSNGQIVTTEFTECTSKNSGKQNETSPVIQCTKECESLIKKKLKTGYHKNEKDAALGTNYVEPMLAKKYGEVDFVFPVYTQPKLDGMRCIVTKDGMWSRTGKPVVSAPHVYNALKPLFLKDQNYIFDGELFCNKYKNDFNAIISLAKQTKPTTEDLVLSEKHLQYWIYDLPSSKKVFSERFEDIQKLVPNHKSLVIVPTNLVNTQEELDGLYAEYLKDGQEGQMIRINDVYENKRSKFLLKRKEFVDDEFRIVDISEGKGNRSGMFGRAHLITSSGVEFEANARGNECFYQELLKNKSKYIGKMATVRYQNLTPDGKPRFGVVIVIRDYE